MSTWPHLLMPPSEAPRTLLRRVPHNSGHALIPSVATLVSGVRSIAAALALRTGFLQRPAAAPLGHCASCGYDMRAHVPAEAALHTFLLDHYDWLLMPALNGLFSEELRSHRGSNRKESRAMAPFFASSLSVRCPEDGKVTTLSHLEALRIVIERLGLKFSEPWFGSGPGQWYLVEESLARLCAGPQEAAPVVRDIAGWVVGRSSEYPRDEQGAARRLKAEEELYRAWQPYVERPREELAGWLIDGLSQNLPAFLEKFDWRDFADRQFPKTLRFSISETTFDEAVSLRRVYAVLYCSRDKDCQEKFLCGELTPQQEATLERLRAVWAARVPEGVSPESLRSGRTPDWVWALREQASVG